MDVCFSVTGSQKKFITRSLIFDIVLVNIFWQNFMDCLMNFKKLILNFEVVLCARLKIIVYTERSIF